jgi:hypothetical protein
MNRYVHIGVVALGLALAEAGTGCSSDNGGGRTQENQKAIVSLKDTRGDLVKGKAEVNDATAALDKLTAGGNLEQSFKQYSAAVKDVEAAGNRARARAQQMRENGRQYVTNWEKETEQITNPELKAGAAVRRQKIRDNYDKIQAAGAAVRDSYQPFLRDLKDIQRVLASDLTPAGVEAASAAISKSKADGATLNERLDAAIAQLDEISGGMSSSASSASAAQPAKKSQGK